MIRASDHPANLADMIRRLVTCLLSRSHGQTGQRGKSRAGHAVVEVALMMPWVFFLFVGALDFGFYSYALISTQNAARVSALNAGFSTANSASQPDACFHARRELAMMPNAQSFSLNCNQAPLVVSVVPTTDTEGSPASRVTVAYDTIPLIPIPGLLDGSKTISRQVSVKVYGE